MITNKGISKIDLFSFVKPILGYERYLVNRNGHIYSDGGNGKMRELTPCKTPSGYLKVWLYKQGKRKMFYIHRLVAKAFLKNPLNLPCINHKDFDKTNNKVENLEPCTSRYNMIYNSLFRKHSSKYVGVTWSKKRRKWQAQYQVGEKKIFLGCYNTEDEAYNAYKNALKKNENYA